MTDQTNRYARRTIKVSGLVQGESTPECMFILEESGIRWNLYGRNEAPETSEVSLKTRFINGAEIPSSLTTSELEWLKALAEDNGLDYAVSVEVKEVSPHVPYMDAPVFFSNESHAFPLDTVQAKVTLSKASGTLIILLESDSADALADPAVNVWTTERVIQVRRGLKDAGFIESDISIDCEVIMGAERITACDTDMMKSMLKEEEE